MTRPAALALAAALLIAACRGTPRLEDETRRVGQLVDSLVPAVEASTGLAFKTPPRYAVRTRDQVRDFVRRKLAEQMPPEQFRLLVEAYSLLGLLPDTLDLPALLEQVLTQQVAGFYDPDSATLYAVAGADPTTQRLTIAHELVHALQDQYLPLDSILGDRRDNDRSSAAQAILEGQANYASIVMLQGREVADSPAFWEAFRTTGDELLGAAGLDRIPAFIREGLLFPYIAGAEFMSWWGRSPLADTLPYGPRMPASTEQIIFPDRYAAGDRPRELTFDDRQPGAYENVLGEFELRVLLAERTGRPVNADAAPLGWLGDRFRVFVAPEGPVLLWFAVWDSEAARDRFAALAAPLARPTRAGVVGQLDTLRIGGLPGTRLIVAPAEWEMWSFPVGAHLEPAPGS